MLRVPFYALAARPRRRTPRFLFQALALTALVISAALSGANSAAATPTPTPAATPKADAAGAAGAATTKATFGVGPATAGRVDSRPNFAYQTAAGGAYSDTVAVTNFGPQALDLQVYASDLSNGSDGALAVAPEQAAGRYAAAWLHLPTKVQAIHVPAVSTNGPGVVVLPVSLRVPSTAQPGDHSASIVASLSTIGKNAKGANVRLDQRVATRVYIRVDGPTHPRLGVSSLSVTYEASSNPIGQGIAHVTYTLRNSGNVNLGAKQLVWVTGMFGTRADATPIVNQEVLFPGAAVKMSIDIPGVHPTIWQNLHIEVTPLVVKGAPESDPTTVTLVKGFYAIPWRLILSLAGGILLLVGPGWYRHRHRRRRRTRPTDVAAGRFGS